MIMIQSARPLDARTLRDCPAPELARSDRPVAALFHRMCVDARVPVQRYEWQGVAASDPSSPSHQGNIDE